MSKLYYKGKDRLGIVERRWKARKIWQGIQLPSSVLVNNNPDGSRRDEPIEMCLDATKEVLESIGEQIFVRNFRKHYLAISTDSPSRISYAGGVAHKFDSNRRIKTNLHRYVARNFPSERELMVERALEMFVEKFKAESVVEFDNLESKFTVVSGDELGVKFRQSYGDSSCMTGSGARYVRMYRDNPDVCKLLLYSDDGVDARAMMFVTNEGRTVVDRVYPNSGRHIEQFKLYCERMDYDLREHMGYPSSDYDHDGGGYPRVEFDGTESPVSITVKVPFRDPDTVDGRGERMMPYMDSFHWGHWIMEDTGMMLCYNNPEPFEGTVQFKFDSTTGVIHKFALYHCCCCGELISDGMRRHGDHEYCSECFDDEFSYCNTCDEYEPREGFTMVRRATGTVTEMCEHCTDRYSNECESCGEIYHHAAITDIADTSGREVAACPDCRDDIAAEVEAANNSDESDS